MSNTDRDRRGNITIPHDGVHFVDVAGNGALCIGVATSVGLYLTR